MGKQWKEKVGKARDITSTFWEYPLVTKDGKPSTATFIAQVIASKDDQVGFTWTVSKGSQYIKPMSVSIGIFCKEIKFYIHFSDVLMCQTNFVKDGACCCGVETLFPMSKLKKCDKGLQWV